MACVPGTPCFENTVNAYYPQQCNNGAFAGYPIPTSSVQYNGPDLPNSGIDTGDTLTLALQKLDNTCNPVELAQNIIAAINQNPSLQVMFCALVNSCSITPTTTTTTTTITPTTTTTTSSSTSTTTSTSTSTTTTTTTTITPTTTTTTTTQVGPTITANYSNTACDTSGGVFQTVTLMNGTSICDPNVYLASSFSMLPTQFYITYQGFSRLFEKDVTNQFAYPQGICINCSTTTTTTTIPPTTTTTTSSTTTTTTTAFIPSGNLDPSFNIGTGFDNGVYTSSIDSSGKTVAGGFFTSYDGSTQNRLVRINSNGSRDTSFNIGTGFNNIVYINAIDSNGKILVGGDFTTYNGLTQSRLVRLNSDGSKDVSFDVGTGFDSTVWALAVDSNGKILVGGNFTSYNGSAQNYLIRLNSDGTKDTSFDIGTGFVGYTSGGIGLVNDILIDSNGKILIGGNFLSYRGVGSSYLIRLNSDGTVDGSFNTGSAFDSWVVSIKIDSNGKIVAGGSFEFFQGLPENKIIRLNSDGSKDTSFNIGTGFGSGIVYSVDIDSSGKVLVGSTTSIYQGTFQPYLVRINSDGSRDTTFNTGTGPNSVVYTTNIDSTGRYIIGGFFTSYNGTSQNFIARLV